MFYNWQHKDWPQFTYEIKNESAVMIDYSTANGELAGITQAFDADVQQKLVIDKLLTEALKTSEIEGELFAKEDVYSSIQRHLGLKPDSKTTNVKAKGIGQLVVHLHNNFDKKLSQSELFKWHTILMQGYRKTKIGSWRTSEEPMQVISGRVGKEVIHFEAPPSSCVPAEMKSFITWFNETAPGKKEEVKNPLIRSALAHIYFETIHPFEDGNGRIGRAISEKVLAQHLGRPLDFSISKIIDSDKKEYYEALKEGQRTLDMTAWIDYFTKVIFNAQQDAKITVEWVLKKSQFHAKYAGKLNTRQMKVVNKLFDAGSEGFEGGMTAKKYMSLTKASKATATRDLQQLYDLDILTRKGGGRSVSYYLM